VWPGGRREGPGKSEWRLTSGRSRGRAIYDDVTIDAANNITAFVVTKQRRP
jgi:hypothetical protein